MEVGIEIAFCGYCERPFDPWKTKSKGGKGEYCSTKCSARHRGRRLAQDNKEVIDKACAFYESGFSIRGTARELDISASSVQTWLENRKIKMRSKSESLRGRKLSAEHVGKNTKPEIWNDSDSRIKQEEE